jgi:hypothetical protein
VRRTETISREIRELRSATSRRKLAKGYRGTLEHVAQRIVNREVNDIRQAVKKFLLDGNLPGFERWLAAFDAQHSEFVREYLHAPLLTYLNLVMAEVERELDKEIDPAAVAEFGEEYVTGRRNAWMADLMRRLRKAYRKPGDVAPADWDAVASMEEWASHREETEAASFAQDETVRGGNALALVVYGIAGVIRKIWRAFGESCSLCKSMDGRVVAIERWFLAAGEGLTGGDGKTFSSMGDVGHPPLHGGCDCIVLAEM